MKVLVLRREDASGTGLLAEETCLALTRRGIDAELLDAGPWLPKSLDPRAEPEISERLRAAAFGFDLVHAFGYRCAWACAEAFRPRTFRRTVPTPWVYTATQMPRTSHPSLTARLDRARCGLCVSRAVLWALEEGLVRNLRQLAPGIDCAGHPPLGPAAAERPTAAAFLADHPTSGVEALLEALPPLWSRVPDARVLIAGPQAHADRVTEAIHALGRGEDAEWLGWVERPEELMAEAHLVVVLRRAAGTSFMALRAMTAGRALLVRREGGLPELVQDLESGFVFENDGDLANMMGAALQTPLRLDAMGRAARVRAETEFEISDRVDSLLAAYRGD